MRLRQNNRPSGLSLGKNSTVQSQSSPLASTHLQLIESPVSRIRGRNSRYARLSQCLDPALISAAPHYGLRYGSAPATGNFQRLRGRPPLVSPLESCMGRSFTAVAMRRITIGTAYADSLPRRTQGEQNLPAVLPAVGFAHRKHQ
jgi:hypothetical protein